MIKIENLSKSFGEHIIFNNFSLEIKDNEFVVFEGVSGCGKTTLLNMIGGIERPDSGKIIVNGFDVVSSEKKRIFYAEHVGFLFQNFALVEKKTVFENLDMVQKKFRNNISISEALDKVGMSGKEKQKIYTLSGGEQQRVAIARLMLKKCSVILADEPTGSLDRHNALMVIELLKKLSSEGKTIIMVTHDHSLISENMRTIQLG